MSSCDICYTEGPQSLNWAKIMKTIMDDLAGFFSHGGWTFLEADNDDTLDEGTGEDSDMEEDDYNPEDDENAGEGSESEDSGDDEIDEDFQDEERDSSMQHLFSGRY